MEKQPHQEYRDELAGKLRGIRNSDPENSAIAKAEAKGYLNAKKETFEYNKFKTSHQEELTPIEKKKLEREMAEEKVRLEDEIKEKIRLIASLELPKELGPDLGIMTWPEALKKIDELNKTLKEGEKPLRMLKEREWDEILKPFTDSKEKGASDEQLDEILKAIRNKYGLGLESYWVWDSPHARHIQVVSMYHGTMDYEPQTRSDHYNDFYYVKNGVRCIHSNFL